MESDANDLINELQTDPAISESVIQQIKEAVACNKKLTKCGREYTEVLPGITTDNVWMLEILGLGKYSKANVVHIDLTDKLAYFLSQASGCSEECIKNLPDYSVLSRNILTLNLDALQNFNIQQLYGLDKMLDSYLLALLGEAVILRKNYSMQDIAEAVAYSLVEKMLRRAATLRDLISIIYKTMHPDIVLRSHGCCDLIFTSEELIEEELELYDSSNANNHITVKVNSYPKLAYLYREVN